ncbi:MAG: DUF418 domain-containing protein [Clostridiales bacterium]|nr:DUF418 domain-containing protein [Clostridiales bacterium]
MKQDYPAPISSNQRIEIIDIIRGFALFGVLIANMSLFKSLALFFPKSPLEYESVANMWHAWGLTLFVQGRFFVIFSFLFGLGFYIFMNRAETKGFKVSKLFSRRMLGLLVMGFLHLAFIWTGDILLAYSIAGLFMMSLRKKSSKSIIKWIVILFVVAIIFMSIVHSMQYINQTFNSVNPEALASWKQNVHDSMASGTYLQILSMRFKNEMLVALIIILPYIVTIVMPLFLMGFYVGKKRYFERVPELLLGFKKIWRISSLLGVLGSIALVLLEIHTFHYSSLIMIISLSLLRYFSGIIVGTFYITSLVLLFNNKKLAKLINGFSHIGKMALTSYLMQSFICVLIFYGFGLGFFGKVSLIEGTIISLVILIIQVYASKLWLNYYKYGPFEWLWRMFTYGKKFSIKR